jgi:hypothetical protein
VGMPASSTLRGDQPTAERVLRPEPNPSRECAVAPGSVRLSQAHTGDAERDRITRPDLTAVAARRSGRAPGVAGSRRADSWPGLPAASLLTPFTVQLEEI